MLPTYYILVATTAGFPAPSHAPIRNRKAIRDGCDAMVNWQGESAVATAAAGAVTLLIAN